MILQMRQSSPRAVSGLENENVKGENLDLSNPASLEPEVKVEKKPRAKSNIKARNANLFSQKPKWCISNTNSKSQLIDPKAIN
jgi:hypothetical protein